MADRTEALMRDLDAPRPIPARMRDRLEGALISATLQPADENLLYILDRPKRLPGAMRERLTATLTGESEADIAERMALLNGPRPLPAGTRSRLMTRLMTRRDSSRMLRITAAAAAAVLIMAGTFALTVSRGPSRDGRRTVLGTQFTQTPTSQPSTGVPNPTIAPTGKTPSVNPPVSQPPRTGAGNPTAPAPRSPDQAIPQPQPTGQIGSGFSGGTASDRGAPEGAAAPGLSIGLLDPVLTLVRNVLAALNAGTVATAPAADAPKPPVAATPAQKASAKKTTTAKPAATKPKSSTPKPAEQPKPLIELPLLGGDGLAVEVPVVELTLSL